jgi:hypothetical protein
MDSVEARFGNPHPGKGFARGAQSRATKLQIRKPVAMLIPLIMKSGSRSRS